MDSIVCSGTVNKKHEKVWSIKVFQLIMVL